MHPWSGGYDISLTRQGRQFHPGWVYSLHLCCVDRVPEFNVGVGWHTQPSPAAASTPERCLWSRFELFRPSQHMTELS